MIYLLFIPGMPLVTLAMIGLDRICGYPLARCFMEDAGKYLDKPGDRL